MKAVQLQCQDGVTAVIGLDNIDRPKLQSPDEVIVKLASAALNHVDLNLWRGENKFTLPHTLGSDGAGTIAAVGKTSGPLKAGDEVCIYPVMSCGRCHACTSAQEHFCAEAKLLSQRGGGTFAEYVRLPARNCFPKPKHLSFEQAAAFPLTYLTAWRMLMTQAQLKPGELVLIVGIGGGVASAALRIAAQLGATTLVTSRSSEKLAKAAKLTNATGIHVTDGRFAEAVRRATTKRGVDVVVDSVGGPSWTESLAALARGGRLVSCGASAGAQPQTNLQRIFWNHLSVFGSSAGSTVEFRDVLRFFETTKTEPIIDRVFPLEETNEAVHYLEDSCQFGKIVLKIGGE